jgi:hypothetical protein
MRFSPKTAAVSKCTFGQGGVTALPSENLFAILGSQVFYGHGSAPAGFADAEFYSMFRAKHDDQACVIAQQSYVDTYFNFKNVCAWSS